MEDQRFDGLVRAIGSGTSRRGALGLLAGIVGLGLDEVSARAKHHGKQQGKGKHKQKGKGKQQAQGTPKPKCTLSKTCAKWCASTFGARTAAASQCTSAAHKCTGVCGDATSSCQGGGKPGSTVCCTKLASGGCDPTKAVSCVDTGSDPSNCGTCGNACTGTTPICATTGCVACSNSNPCPAGGCCTTSGACVANGDICAGNGTDCSTATCQSGVCQGTPVSCTAPATCCPAGTPAAGECRRLAGTGPCSSDDECCSGLCAGGHGCCPTCPAGCGCGIPVSGGTACTSGETGTTFYFPCGYSWAPPCEAPDVCFHVRALPPAEYLCYPTCVPVA